MRIDLGNDAFQAGGALIAGGVFSFFGGFKQLARKRLIENTPRSKVRSLAVGPVEVHGKARSIYKLQTPFTQLPCVYFAYEIQEYKKSGKSSRWVTILKGSSEGVEFMVEDETGAVAVDAKGAEVVVPEDHVFTNSWGSSLPSGCADYLASHGQSTHAFFGLVERSLRFKESCVMEGDPLFVFGFATPRKDSRLDAKTALIERLREIKRDPRLMARFDTDRDGQVSPEEWERARKLVEAEVVRSLPAESPALVLRNHVDHRMMIADRSEADLLGKLGRRVLLMIPGGVALVAVAESYPDLTATQGFMQLQARISTLEDHIADRREYFNSAVNGYNVRIEQIPDVFVARMLAYSAKALFQVAEHEKASPEISFNHPR